MLFAFSLAAAVLFSVIFSPLLRRHPWPFYIIAIALSAWLSILPVPAVKGFVNDYLFDMFRRGTIGTAFFVVVMYMATLKNGSQAIKTLMPIRGQLSIIASILCLCHTVFFGLTYFVMLFTMPQKMSPIQIATSIIFIIMLCIMIPLFIMSFPRVRRKMNPKKWKKIQRTAYVFYGLMYVHIMVVMLPGALHGYVSHAINVTVYSVVFACYAVLRVRKAKFNVKLPFQMLAAVAAACVVMCAWNGVAMGLQNRDTDSEDEDELEEAYSGTLIINGADVVSRIVISDGKIVAVYNEAIASAGEKTEKASGEADEHGDPSMPDEHSDPSMPDEQGGSQSSNETEKPGESETDGAEETADSWIDGTYSGKGAGYGGKVIVEVDIVDGRIDAIRIQEDKEDEPYRTNALAVIDDMILNQTYDVDAVSGATSTSDAIITGVRRALKKASGGE